MTISKELLDELLKCCERPDSGTRGQHRGPARAVHCNWWHEARRRKPYTFANSAASLGLADPVGAGGHDLCRSKAPSGLTGSADEY